MRNFKSFALATLIGVAAIGLPASSARAATLIFDGTTLTGATGVTVSGFLGITFDVALRDGSCFSIYSDCDDPAEDFDFTFPIFAEFALDALFSQVYAGTTIILPANIFGCGSETLCLTLVPYAVNSGSVSVGLLTYRFPEASGSVIDCVDCVDVTADFRAASAINFARFTPVVIPLPAALPLYGTGLAVMGFMGWRRKRQALRD